MVVHVCLFFVRDNDPLQMFALKGTNRSLPNGDYGGSIRWCPFSRGGRLSRNPRYTVDGRKPALVEIDNISLLFVMFQASQVVQDFFHRHEVAETPWLDHDCNLFLNGWKSGEVFWPGTTGYLGPKLFKAFPNSHFDCEQESLHFPLCFEIVRWKSLDPLIFLVQNPGVAGKIWQCFIAFTFVDIFGIFLFKVTGPTCLA